MQHSNKQVKATITILMADNSNQRAFLTSARLTAGALGALSFMLKDRARHRVTTRRDLTNALIKDETQEEEGAKDTPTSNSSKGTKATPGTDAASKKSQKGDSSEAISAIDLTKDDLFGVDDTEAALLGNCVSFYARDSTTELETAKDTATRLKLYSQLVLATPYHAHTTRICKEGNCHGYLKLILTNIRVTGQSRYNSLIALHKVQFTV